MLANIDVLVAIWNGNDAAGILGTAQIVSRALADGILVVWIEPANPNAIPLSWSPAGDVPPANSSARPKETFRRADDAALARAIDEIVCPPRRGQAQKALKLYMEETERRWNFCPWYPLLLLLAGRTPRRTDFHFRQSLIDLREQWRKFLAVMPPDSRSARQWKR